MRITEIKSVEVRVCIPENPIMLRWLNNYGGWEHWLFGKTQTESMDTESEVFQKFIEDIEAAETKEQSHNIVAIEAITLGADDLSRNQVLGLKTILHSSRVQMLVSVDDFTKWLTVVVQPGSFRIFETESSKGEIELTIFKPSLEINNV